MRISDWSSDVCSSDLDLHLQHRAVRLIERGFPKLLGVHFAQSLVALDRQALAPCLENRLQQFRRKPDRASGRLLRRLALAVLVFPGRRLFDCDQPRRLGVACGFLGRQTMRSEEHTSELQSLLRISYAVL